MMSECNRETAFAVALSAFECGHVVFSLSPFDHLSLLELTMKVIVFLPQCGLQRRIERALSSAHFVVETVASAQDCVDQGFATAIVEPPAKEEARAMAAARRFKALGMLKHVPEKFKAAACACDCENCVNGECSDCNNQACADENCMDCPMQSGASAKASVANAPVCSCPCQNCANGKCSDCSSKDCADENCMDCPMQASAADRSKTEMEMARARVKARNRRLAR